MFKGIVLFGPPASGKTTIGKNIAAILSNMEFNEASTSIIYPLVNKPIPDNFDDINLTATIDNIDRTTARNIYSALVEKHGDNIIGRIIDKLFQNTIIAGVRGFENAKYLYQKGYLVVYLYAPIEILVQRNSTLSDINAEELLYSTSKIAQYTNLSFDTTTFSINYITDFITKLFTSKECRTCVNIDFNLATPIGDNGLCIICNNYQNNFNSETSDNELQFIKSFITNKKYDVMVGMSGGKDSSVTAYKLLELGFTPIGFTFDIGYYPEHIMFRAAAIAKTLNIDHEIINIKNTVTNDNRQSYRLTYELYSQPYSEELSKQFREIYMENRRHYSVKYTTPMPYIRSCQLCRKTVIPAYYREAVKRGISLVVLGINEWTALSQQSGKFMVSGIRRLQPEPDLPVVYIVHLPFLLRLSRLEMKSVLDKIGWQKPNGEEFIESNCNSCLFAAATMDKARHMLGFNPDITRLSREVTVGFITKDEAKQALLRNCNAGLDKTKLI